MDFYIVRHGRVASNDLKIYNGCRVDEDLNEVGVEQAKQTRDNLRDTPLDVIVSSTMTRARHTAAIINEGRDLPIVCDARLVERDMGDLTGQLWGGTAGLTAEQLEQLHIEPIPALCARVAAALDEIRETYAGKRVLIVSHGGASKAICAYFEGMPEDGSLKKYKLLDNCEVRHYSI